MLDGRVELGMVGARPDQRVLQAVELMPDELVVVVPPGHAWVGRKEVTVADLTSEPLIVREPGSEDTADEQRRHDVQQHVRSMDAGGRRRAAPGLLAPDDPVEAEAEYRQRPVEPVASERVPVVLTEDTPEIAVGA